MEGISFSQFHFLEQIVKCSRPMSASLIGRLGSSAFRLSAPSVSMSLAGTCFSSESAPRNGIRGRGGTIFRAALPSIERQVQADMRTHLIHRPARDIFHRSVELEFSPIGFDPERFSCCCRGLLPGPPELRTINPDAVHDDGFSSLIGRLRPSAFRLSTTTLSMSLAGSCFSSESAPSPLYGAFFVKEFARAANLLSFVSFFVRSQSPFLRPDPPVR